MASPEVAEPPEASGEVPTLAPLVEEHDEISEELTKTAKDLRSVSTIRALQKGLTDDEGEPPITTREAFELKKLQTMFPSTPAGPTQPQLDVQALLDQQAARYEKLLAEREEKRTAEERDLYKAKLEEKEKAEAHAQELAMALQPFQDRLDLLDERLKEMAQKTSPESKEPPTSAELQAIRELGVSIKEGLQAAIAGKEGKAGEALGEYIDNISVLIDKVTGMAAKVGKGETPPELDWKTAMISTMGEVAQEGIKAYKEVEAVRKPEEEEGAEQPGLSKQIIERKVHHYAMNLIAQGKLEVNPYQAAEDLGLTADQVWEAIQSLQKRGALKQTGQVKESGTTPQPRRSEAEIGP